MALMVILAGCAHTSAPEIAHFNGQKLQISAEVNPGLFDGELTLFIDGDIVIKERSQAFGGSSQSFEGTWKGHQVTARATTVYNLLSHYTQIDVFIAGQLVETLTI